MQAPLPVALYLSWPLDEQVRAASRRAFARALWEELDPAPVAATPGPEAAPGPDIASFAPHTVELEVATEERHLSRMMIPGEAGAIRATSPSLINRKDARARAAKLGVPPSALELLRAEVTAAPARARTPRSSPARERTLPPESTATE